MADALAQWLALREPTDAAARSASLTHAVADAIAAHEPVHVLDLATGTGSNIRYLIDRLRARRQRWLAVDRSATLLAELPARMSVWAAARGYEVTSDATACVIRGERMECRIETRQLNIDTLDAAEIFAHRHLVTVSALLDLVSEQWLRSLAARCRAAGSAALFTITYNGLSSSSPMEPEDGMVLDLFNRHQRTDKGLGGRAAGPDAAVCAARCFAEAGYRVQSEPSDWKLGAGEPELQRQLIQGWAEAATEVASDAASTIASWRIRRLRHVESGRSKIVVGHDDVAAWLPAGSDRRRRSPRSDPAPASDRMFPIIS